MLGGGKIDVSALKEKLFRNRRWGLPVVAALVINAGLLLLLSMAGKVRLEYGTPAPDELIPVVILAAERPAPAPPAVPEVRDEETEIAPEPSPEPETAPEEEILPEAEPVPEPEAPPPPPEPIVREAPEIDLPEGEGGGPSGVIAIFCPEVFDDADKAAECAGRRQIRSGWRPEDSDWSQIAESLRRGGVNVPRGPAYGPDGRVPLADNETYYEPQDLRAILGPERARAVEDARKGRWLREGRRGVYQTTNPVAISNSNTGHDVPYFIGDTWEPSWTQREDPDISLRDLEELVRRGESGEE